MEWTDSGIIINNAEYSDTAIILGCLTENHGLRYGLINKSKNKNNITLGNKVEISWRGRLETHLGRFFIRTYTTTYQHIYHDYMRLTALLSICSLISISIPEKEKQELLYIKLSNMMDLLANNDILWINSLVKLELYLLSITGFGLELNKCTVTETTHNLKYISPKTGKAVSLEAGKQYEDKLFPLLDIFIKYQPKVNIKEALQALNILTHFLEKHLLSLKNVTMPQYRNELLETLKTKQIYIE